MNLALSDWTADKDEPKSFGDEVFATEISSRTFPEGIFGFTVKKMSLVAATLPPWLHHDMIAVRTTFKIGRSGSGDAFVSVKPLTVGPVSVVRIERGSATVLPQNMNRVLSTHARVNLERIANLEDVTACAEREDGVVPNEASLRLARRFLGALSLSAHSPEATVHEDGRIGFDWITDTEIPLSVIVGDDGMLTFAGHVGGNFGNGRERWTGTIPRPILEWIGRVSR